MNLDSGDLKFKVKFLKIWIVFLQFTIYLPEFQILDKKSKNLTVLATLKKICISDPLGLSTEQPLSKIGA